MYDLITDVHGHAKILIALLLKLGYEKIGNSYHHPTRMALFIGDYIDRGPDEIQTCEIVKGMVDAGDAIALMGNHEYNAICYATMHEGQYLRKHDDRNYNTHKEFLAEYPLGSEKHKEIIEWFKTLPLFMEFGGRAVHACWDNKSIAYLKTRLNSDNTLNDDFLIGSCITGSDDFIALEIILKGHEITLPDNKTWSDPYGIKRRNVRLNWFVKQENPTYKNAVLSCSAVDMLPDIPIENAFYYEDKIPVFFGHYWLTGEPGIQSGYIACLDYSVAKDGKLVAYRWNGEKKLSSENMVY
jgi:diadenosine tetraphosphatase ApaH/serine/threonine PP2A family protein phosphatase